MSPPRPNAAQIYSTAAAAASSWKLRQKAFPRQSIGKNHQRRSALGNSRDLRGTNSCVRDGWKASKGSAGRQADHSSLNDKLKPLFSSRPDFFQPADWPPSQLEAPTVRLQLATMEYKVEYQNEFLALAAGTSASFARFASRLESHQRLGQASFGQAPMLKAFELFARCERASARRWIAGIRLAHLSIARPKTRSRAQMSRWRRRRRLRCCICSASNEPVRRPIIHAYDCARARGDRGAAGPAPRP